MLFIYDALVDPDILWFFSPRKQNRLMAMSVEDRGRRLTGPLWNCTDVLPGSACDELNLPHGSSHASARALRQEINGSDDGQRAGLFGDTAP